VDRSEVIRYCLSLPGAYEDHPFGGDTAVLRHKGNRKSFALLIFAHGRLHLNLKCEPMRADFLRQVYRGVIPAYHMNKTHWNSVFLDEDVPGQDIQSMIDHSYELTRPRSKRRR